jgi:hypothetical protein
LQVAIKILDKEKIQKQNMGAQIKKEVSLAAGISAAGSLALLPLRVAARASLGWPVRARPGAGGCAAYWDGTVATRGLLQRRQRRAGLPRLAATWAHLD